MEAIHQHDKEASIDVIVKRGNESLLKDHPFINEVIPFDKSNGKVKSLNGIVKKIRKRGYDYCINIHRFGSSGYLAWRSKAEVKVGFKQNPFSWSYTHKVEHKIGQPNVGEPLHEIERNNELLACIGIAERQSPRLYPGDADFAKIANFTQDSFITMSPASVWHTKAMPGERWIELINQLSSFRIYLLGGPEDIDLLNEIIAGCTHNDVVNMAGKLSLLQSAALMSKARQNFVNDSAPMHLASAMDAPTCAIYCSTVPEFGFGPLSGNNAVVQVTSLDCKPCGLHGHKACPEGHFKCGEIPVEKLLETIR